MSLQILNTSKPTLPSPPQPHIHHPSVPLPPKIGRHAAGITIVVAAASAIPNITLAQPRAQEAAAAAAAAVPCIPDLPVTAKAFLDVSIGTESAGKITIGLFGDEVSTGASRFLSLGVWLVKIVRGTRPSRR
ncbi:hypothetical protein OsI_26318 [Oryza sativa Indica Group]|uniref:Uncharacterized protein n=1 Tax=Oryza sativa subsp. indica TaxID=39946 RepID=A2YM65_ORYSI|nr:hypothetical protein OsI_26318 [Oryza sativa Indica Group]